MEHHAHITSFYDPLTRPLLNHEPLAAAAFIPTNPFTSCFLPAQVLKKLDADTLQAVVPLVCQTWLRSSQSVAVWEHRLHPILLQLSQAETQSAPCTSTNASSSSPCETSPTSCSTTSTTSSSKHSNVRNTPPPSSSNNTCNGIRNLHSSSSSSTWGPGPPPDRAWSSPITTMQQQLQQVVPLALLHYAVHARNFLRNPAFLQAKNSDIARLLRIRGSSAAKTYEQKLEAWVSFSWQRACPGPTLSDAVTCTGKRGPGKSFKHGSGNESIAVAVARVCGG